MKIALVEYALKISYKYPVSVGSSKLKTKTMYFSVYDSSGAVYYNPEEIVSKDFVKNQLNHYITHFTDVCIIGLKKISISYDNEELAEPIKL